MPKGEPLAVGGAQPPEPPPAGVPGEPAGLDRPLSAVVKRPPVTCLPSDSIESVLRTMAAESGAGEGARRRLSA